MLDIAHIRELEDKRVYHNPTQAALRRLHQTIHQGLQTEVGCFAVLLLAHLTVRSHGQTLRSVSRVPGQVRHTWAAGGAGKH